MASILDIKCISKAYEREQLVLKELSLSLEAGELLGLLGASGSGKTTLLRLIAGFERPDSGTISIQQQQVAGKGRWIPPEGRQVGVVFQDYALFPHLTLHDNVAFGLRSLSRTERIARVQEVVALVGLEALGDRYPAELSGGQQQRVALARALAPRPQLVLMDEPFSNLDAGIRFRLRLEVREILHQAKMAAIFVTHDREEALSISDRVAVLHLGRLEQCDCPEELYGYPKSRYVAEFVTQANFLPARWTAAGWESEIGTLTVVRDEGECNHTKLGEWADIMVRQEDCMVRPDAASAVRVRGRQFLGREAIYCLQLPSGRELHVRQTTENLPLEVGTSVRVECLESRLQMFPCKGME
ncbi:MAG: ABC transporter ATP-binding protein [Cyanobacteria bacterium P01_D01_bin.123]